MVQQKSKVDRPLIFWLQAKTEIGDQGGTGH